jgi:quinol monooxygenase YgiN
LDFLQTLSVGSQHLKPTFDRRIVETRCEEGVIKFEVHQFCGKKEGLMQEQRGEEEARGLESLRS